MRNPKLAGSNIYDCRPQVGKCPVGCNQCFYNYQENIKPRFPDVSVGSIVRVNCGHDSNINRDWVISSTERYSNRFFNTSIPDFDFPGPVVWTANPKEEKSVKIFKLPANLMFVRLRVSINNLALVEDAVKRINVPIVLTFMRYHDNPIILPSDVSYGYFTENYTFKKHLINDYWCPTDAFMSKVYKMMYSQNNLVSICGKLCKDCKNCEIYYWQCQKRLFNLEGVMI